ARAVPVPHAAGGDRRAAHRRRAAGGGARAPGDGVAGRALAGARRRRAHGHRGRRGSRGGGADLLGVSARPARRAQRDVRGGLRPRLPGAAPRPPWGRGVRCRAAAGAGGRARGGRAGRGPRLSRACRPGPGAVRGRHGHDRVRRQRRRAGEDGGDRCGARRRVGDPGGAVMRSPLATIRNRILVGLVLLMLGLVVTAIAGAATLRHMRYAVADELAGLRSSMDVGSGLVTSVLEEIRAAEQYLASPGADARRLFQTTADDAFVYERRLDALTGLTAEDRLTVNRLKQLHATIQTEYSIAHALKDLGRDQEA